MTKAILSLSLLLALPLAAEKVKPPTPQEMMVTIQDLRETVEEQQERLRLHKLEIDALRQTIAILESRLESLEKTASNPQSPAVVARHP